MGIFLRFLSILLCLFLLSSCSPFKGSKKTTPVAADDKMISMTTEEVAKTLGEPTIVSKESDGRIIWTYNPSWKLTPSNTGTTYVEFENGKVVKVIRVR